MGLANEILQSPRHWVLRNRQGERLLLTITQGEGCTVGREPCCDLPILDAGISRRHARFFSEEGGLWIEDLGSQNGTFLNGERVWRSQVRPGDILTLGRIPLTVLQQEPPAAIESAGPRLLKGFSPDRLAFLSGANFKLADAFDRPSLHQLILELIVEELRADRGALLVPERGKYEVVAAHPREGFRELSSLANLQLCQSIFQSKTGRILRGLPGRPGALSSSPGISGGRETTAICAPLFGREEALGVLILEAFTDHRSYGTGDVDCLLAYAAIAGRWLDAACRLSRASAMCEEHQKRSLRQESELDRIRSKLREAERWAGFGRLLSSCLGRLAEATGELNVAGGELTQIPSAARRGRELLRTAKTLEKLISGLSFLCEAGTDAGPAGQVSIRRLIEGEAARLDLPDRDRIRWMHTDPSLTVETVHEDALCWMLARILEAALARPVDPTKIPGPGWPLGRGPEVLIKLTGEGEDVFFTCEVPGEMDSPEAQAPGFISTGGLDPAELHLMRRIASEVLGGEFLLHPPGPVRAYSLRVPIRPRPVLRGDETAVLQSHQLGFLSRH